MLKCQPMTGKLEASVIVAAEVNHSKEEEEEVTYGGLNVNFYKT